MSYLLKIIDSITKDKQSADDQSKWVYMSYYNTLTIEFEELSLESMTQALNDLLEAKLKKESLLLNTSIYGTFDLVENADGLVDPKGDYLVNYTFVVKPVQPFIDLQTLKEEHKLHEQAGSL